MTDELEPEDPPDEDQVETDDVLLFLEDVSEVINELPEKHPLLNKMRLLHHLCVASLGEIQELITEKNYWVTKWNEEHDGISKFPEVAPEDEDYTEEDLERDLGQQLGLKDPAETVIVSEALVPIRRTTICGHCSEEGELVYTGIALFAATEEGVVYVHECEKCQSRVSLNEKYPRVDFETHEEWDNEEDEGETK